MEAALRTMAPALARDGYELVGRAERRLQFDYSYRPGWVAIPVILVPIPGVLALLIKEHDRVTVDFEPAPDGGTRLVVHGRAPRRVRRAFAQLSCGFRPLGQRPGPYPAAGFALWASVPGPYPAAGFAPGRTPAREPGPQGQRSPVSPPRANNELGNLALRASDRRAYSAAGFAPWAKPAREPGPQGQCSPFP